MPKQEDSLRGGKSSEMMNHEPPSTRTAWPVLSGSRRAWWYFGQAQQNCERRTPSVSSGGAVYSIVTIYSMVILIPC
jgi:hypothetical protein